MQQQQDIGRRLIILENIPQTVLEAIKAAPKTSDIYSVTGDTAFSGQILKADTVTFASRSSLTLESLTFPWIAIVAKTIKVAAPDERFSILVPTQLVALPKAPAIAPLPQPPKAAKGGEAQNGAAGATGAVGVAGNSGVDAPSVPALYLIAGRFVTQPGNEKPDYLDIAISAPGIDGGDGGDGQSGQRGQDGGDGGRADWHDPAQYPFDPGCKAGAGFGGRGGDGGMGGPGGLGGKGSNGATVIFAGSDESIELWEFSKVKTLPGRGGAGGRQGRNGLGGVGGARGEHVGACQGGGSGQNGQQPTQQNSPGQRGPDGQRGVIYKHVLDVGTLF